MTINLYQTTNKFSHMQISELESYFKQRMYKVFCLNSGLLSRYIFHCFPNNSYRDAKYYQTIFFLERKEIQKARVYR